MYPYYIELNSVEIDELANLMLDVDVNFKELKDLWNTKKKYRIINSPLVGDGDNAIHAAFLLKE